MIKPNINRSKKWNFCSSNMLKHVETKGTFLHRTRSRGKSTSATASASAAPVESLEPAPSAGTGGLEKAERQTAEVFLLWLFLENVWKHLKNNGFQLFYDVFVQC